MSSTSSNNNNNPNVATYKWVLSNFSRNQKLNSSRFGFPVDNGVLFYLCFNPLISIHDWQNTRISIHFRSYNSNQDGLELKHRLFIVNSNGDKCHAQEGTSILARMWNSAQYKFVRDLLRDSANQLNDTLTVVCEIELANQCEDTRELPGDFSAISKHYRLLLESGKQSDVVLAIGEKEFRAHKLVLSARSPVFAAMFDHLDMKEAQQGRVNIMDISIEVFELFLSYIYTGKIDGLDRFAPELLAAADMYQMDCLKTLCEQFLCSKLTIENVSQLLIHADLYRAEVLKSKCIDYITDNSEQVKATQGWSAVKIKADLLVLLFDKLSIKLNSAFRRH